MNTYLISDLHLGHIGMSVKRGFASIEEHDEHIISNFNSVVDKKDTVWILGDLTMEKKTNYPILNRLNGIKKVVLGNHDRPQDVPYLLQYVKYVCGMYDLTHKPSGRKLVLTHCPIHESEMSRFDLNVHGHVHDKSLPDKRYFNVSCEVLNYKPININDL